MRKAVWTIVFSCLVFGQAAARDIFVDNVGGNDRNQGRHPRSEGDTSGPVRTIAKALRLAQAGDRIALAPSAEPYRECLSLVGVRHGGAGSQLPFILEGNGATLDGSAPIPAEGWTFFRDNIFRFRPSRMIRPVLFFKGRPVRPLPVPPGRDFPPRLEPLEWCAIGGAIYFAVDRNRLPADYQLSYAQLPTGITLYQVQQVVIRHLTIRGYQADGIAAAAGARDIVLDKVTCTANGQSGVCVGGAAQVEIESCRLFGNGQSQLLTQADSETHVLASMLSNDTARGWVDRGGRTYLADKRVEGGRKSLAPADAPLPPKKKP